MFSEKVTRLKVFKTLSLFFLIVSLLLLFSGVVQGDLAPEFTLTDIDGNTFSLSDFRGKVVIIEFFSKYCWACVDEIPHLKAVYNEFGEEELVIISLGRWGNNTQLIDFRNEHEIPWIVAKDAANLFTLYNCKGVPHLYLIDHEGAITYDHNGIVEASVIVEKVNELLTLIPEPPVISVLFPENKTYSVTDVSLTFIVSESTSWIGFSLNGQANVTIIGNTTLTGLSDGMHSLTVYANSTDGNIGSSGTVYFTIDSPPDILFLLPENKTYDTTEIPLSFTVTETGSWMGYSLDGQANTTITGNTTLTGLSDDSHSLIVYVSDGAGNIGSSGLIYFTVDTVLPSVLFLLPENKTYDTTEIPLSFTVTETGSWMGYSLDGQANTTITGNTTLTSLLDGSHYVVVYANDTGGNMGASYTIYFTVDATSPNILDVSQTPLKNNVVPEDEVKINATVTDALSGIKQVTLNYNNGNGAWAITEMTNIEGNIWQATLPQFPSGTNVTYVISAEDNAGNVVNNEELGYEYQYQVIPEFPTWTPMLLILIALAVALVIYKRRLHKTSIH